MKGLKYQRVTRELSQTDVAKAVGVSQSLYCQWERGERQMKEKHMIALAQYFGCSLDELL